MPSLHPIFVNNGSPNEDLNFSVHRKGELSLSAKPLELNLVVSGHVHHVMRGVTDDYNPSLHNVGLAYVLSMVLIAIIAFTGQLVVQVFVSTSFRDSRLVNTAGMQRMYNQKIAKCSVALLLFDQSSPNFMYYKNELQDSLSNLEEGYVSLRDGNVELNIPRNDDKHRTSLFNQSKPYFMEIIKNGKIFLNMINSTSSTPVTKLKPAVQVVLDNESKLAKYLNEIATSYAREANHHLKTVLKITWAFTSVVLFIIVIEGFFVIRPIIMQLQTLMSERFDLLRAGLEAEAAARSVSLIMVKYVGHEVKEPLSSTMRTIKATGKIIRSIINVLESSINMTEKNENSLPLSSTLPSSSTNSSSSPSSSSSSSSFSSISSSILFSCQSVLLSLAKAQENCRLMATVVDDVDNVCMLERGQIQLQKTVIQIKELVPRVFETVEQTNKSIRLQYEPVENVESMFFVSDEHRITQVLINLISNAMKFMKEEGTVTVRVSSPSNGQIRFEIVDTGCGLSEEDCAKVLQPFRNGSGSVTEQSAFALEGGTGLGLYICKLLVELLGGVLGVSSVLGEGSTFWFQLPFKPPPAPEDYHTHTHAHSNSNPNSNSNSNSRTHRHASPSTESSPSVSEPLNAADSHHHSMHSMHSHLVMKRENGVQKKDRTTNGSDECELCEVDKAMPLTSIEEGCHRGRNFMLTLSGQVEASRKESAILEEEGKHGGGGGGCEGERGRRGDVRIHMPGSSR